MHLQMEPTELREIVREVVSEVLAAIDWPEGRLALSEAEAAAACGLGRHVFRDLRLSGRLTSRRLGRRILYTRNDLLRVLGALDQCDQSNGRHGLSASQRSQQ